MSISNYANHLEQPTWMHSLRRFWVQPSANAIDSSSLLQEIRQRAGVYQNLSDDELSLLAIQCVDRGFSNKTTTIALAAGVEAARRVLQIELHDCQILGGLGLVRGSVVQLRTGEGKTFVAMLAAIGFAFSGRSPHVMTVNSYLARRDFEQLAPVYKAVGLRVGLTDSEMTAEEKRRGYRCDIVYGPGYEFGFDFLRDSLSQQPKSARRLGDRVLQRWRSIESKNSDSIQSDRSAAIVDEADSVLLDEASTPLVLSSGQKRLAANAEVYRAAHAMTGILRAGEDYQLSSHDGSFQWSDTGIAKWKQPSATIRNGMERAWPTYLQQAIYATQCLQRDVHYLIAEDRVQIVDQHTGRILLDRTWGAGLQQAVEAKEGVPITAENQALATITRQRFLRSYTTLCGLTGTAEGSEREFKDVYRMEVVSIPPNRPSQLIQMKPQLFRDRVVQEKAIVARIKICQLRNQPVLIGTTSIQSSDRLANIFAKAEVSHRLLSGRQDAEEADIIAQAGQAGAVTIATNIAGRGTDIRLGPGVTESGGLHAIATELHESLRVERQLMGRAARQGDAGSFELILSIDDPLLVRFAPDLVRRFKGSIQGDLVEGEHWISELRELQRRLESQRVDQRRQMFAHDDWKESVVRELDDQ